MAKFPSQRKLLYETGNIADDASYNVLTSGGTAGHLNLPKDLSILNRRGYASTTRKGVPLVYQCKVDFYMHNFAGQGLESAVLPADTQTILKIKGVQNNWVMRNAAVKFHAAREKMFADAGVRKSDRGAYSHEIRYNFDGASDSFLRPVDGDGNAFTGGTWDVTTMSYAEDPSFQLGITGDGDDEETNAFSGTYLGIGHSYLVSRVNQQADTNLQAEEGPAFHSVLKSMLAEDTITENTDDIVGTARGEQDNPPYEVLDLSDSGDVAHDITEPVELGRAVAGFGNAYGSVIIDVPFGICDMTAKMTQSADTANISGLVCVEVLDIYEMQG
jgi:hypothetical protein